MPVVSCSRDAPLGSQFERGQTLKPKDASRLVLQQLQDFAADCFAEYQYVLPMSTAPLADPPIPSIRLCTRLFAASILASLPYVQCLGDDTYIYMRLIDNLLDRGRLEYNPGEPCYGMTSVTWFFAWAAVKALTGSMDVSRYLISFAGHVLAFVGVLQLARRLIRDPVIVLCVVAAIVFDPFYLRWFWSGWEMSAKIAAAAWALLALIRCARRQSAQGRPAFPLG